MSISDKLSFIAPQFDSRSGRDEFIALATIQVNVCWFGTKYEYAVAYLAAHLMKVNPESTNNPESEGIISTKREGDLSISYTNFGVVSDEDLSRTTYGKQFINLRNQSNSFLGVTGGNLCQ